MSGGKPRSTIASHDDEVKVIRESARALKQRMDQVYSEDLEPFRKRETQVLINNLVERAESLYLDEDKEVSGQDFQEMRRELRLVVKEIVAEEFGVEVEL